MSHATLPVQPALPEQPQQITQMQPQRNMDAMAPMQEESKQNTEVMRLRGGCPGRFCGLPILPCRCDICIIPIPCC